MNIKRSIVSHSTQIIHPSHQLICKIQSGLVKKLKRFDRDGRFPGDQQADLDKFMYDMRIFNQGKMSVANVYMDKKTFKKALSN